MVDANVNLRSHLYRLNPRPQKHKARICVSGFVLFVAGAAVMAQLMVIADGRPLETGKRATREFKTLEDAAKMLFKLGGPAGCAVFLEYIAPLKRLVRVVSALGVVEGGRKSPDWRGFPVIVSRRTPQSLPAV